MNNLHFFIIRYTAISCYSNRVCNKLLLLFHFYYNSYSFNQSVFTYYASIAHVFFLFFLLLSYLFHCLFCCTLVGTYERKKKNKNDDEDEDNEEEDNGKIRTIILC